MVKWLMVLWCLFAIGDYCYIDGADAHLPVIIDDIYINKKGECIYKVYHRKFGYEGECYQMYYFDDFYELRYENQLIEAKDKNKMY
jgi:hypothetical protein